MAGDRGVLRLDGNELLAARLRRRCERAGRGTHAEVVVSWLTEVVQTILPGPQAALADLVNVLPEMEFWLPAHRMEAKEIDAQCRQHLLTALSVQGWPSGSYTAC